MDGCRYDCRSAPELKLYASALEDLGREECRATVSEVELSNCTLGDSTSSAVVVLFGDSHAFHWLPAVEEVATDRGWRLETVVKASCTAIDETRWHERLGRPYWECDEWRAKALARIDSLRPDLVLVSSSYKGYEGIEKDKWVGGITRLLQRFAVSSDVVLIRDIPGPDFEATVCLSRQAGRNSSGSACSFYFDDPDESAVYRAQVSAADAVENVRVMDLNEHICRSGQCNPLVGDSVVVWRDRHHMTATFARTLGPTLSRSLDGVLVGGAQRSGASSDT